MDEVKPKTIVFCIPGKSFSREFLQSWTELFTWCTFNGIRPFLSTAYSPNCYYVRNICLGGNTLRGVSQIPFNGSDYDYTMWIDSDIVFTIENFKRLLDADKEIVSGMYLMDNTTHYATVEVMNHDIYKTKGYYEFLSREEASKKTDLFSVDYTGFGWILVKKGVFESLEYPWFRPTWFEYDNQIKEFATEDVSFCQTIREKGYTIWIDPKVIVGHQKVFTI